MAVGRRDCHSEHALHSHSMATVAPIVEETTGAVPFPVIVVGRVDIVFPPKRRLKACKLDAFGFLSVAFGFSNLIDHA